MIKRESHMSRIRPFIGTELVKVMAGIRRCGRSSQLELISRDSRSPASARRSYLYQL